MREECKFIFILFFTVLFLAQGARSEAGPSQKDGVDLQGVASKTQKSNEHAGLWYSREKVESLYGKPYSNDKYIFPEIPYFCYSRGELEIDIYYSESEDVVQAIDFQKSDGKFSDQEIQELLGQSKGRSEWIEVHAPKRSQEELEKSDKILGIKGGEKNETRIWELKDRKVRAVLSGLAFLSIESGAYLRRFDRVYRNTEEKLKANKRTQ